MSLGKEGIKAGFGSTANPRLNMYIINGAAGNLGKHGYRQSSSDLVGREAGGHRGKAIEAWARQGL